MAPPKGDNSSRRRLRRASFFRQPYAPLARAAGYRCVAVGRTLVSSYKLRRQTATQAAVKYATLFTRSASLRLPSRTSTHGGRIAAPRTAQRYRVLTMNWPRQPPHPIPVVPVGEEETHTYTRTPLFPPLLRPRSMARSLNGSTRLERTTKTMRRGQLLRFPSALAVRLCALFCLSFSVLASCFLSFLGRPPPWASLRSYCRLGPPVFFHTHSFIPAFVPESVPSAPSA